MKNIQKNRPAPKLVCYFVFPLRSFLILFVCFLLSSCVSISKLLPQKRVIRSHNCFTEKPRKDRELILFIHGLNGDAYATWENFPCLIKKNKRLDRQYDIASYSYPTSLWKGAKIQTLSRDLRTKINNRYFNYEKISLISHSMGGLVARQYILEEFKDGKTIKINNLILYSVPNNGSDLAKYVEFLSLNRQLEQLTKGSDFIQFLNNDWMRRKEKIHSAIDIKYVIAADDIVVDMESAQNYWGNSNTETLVDKNHSNIVKPKNENDDSFIIAKNLLLGELPRGSGGSVLKPPPPEPKNRMMSTVGVYIEKIRHNSQATSYHIARLRGAIESAIGDIKNAKILQTPIKADILISSYLGMRGEAIAATQGNEVGQNKTIVEEFEVIVRKRETKAQIYKKRVRAMVLDGVIHKIESDSEFQNEIKNARTSKN